MREIEQPPFVFTRDGRTGWWVDYLRFTTRFGARVHIVGDANEKYSYCGKETYCVAYHATDNVEWIASGRCPKYVCEHCWNEFRAAMKGFLRGTKTPTQSLPTPAGGYSSSEADARDARPNPAARRGGDGTRHWSSWGHLATCGKCHRILAESIRKHEPIPFRARRGGGAK